jgi:porin
MKRPFAKAILGLTSVGEGGELFYNIEVSPWFHLTPDQQIIEPSVGNAGTVVVVGFRAKADF